MARKIEIPNLDNLLERYVAGESELKLSCEVGINRWTFRQRLIKAGIPPRGQSETERLKWARMSPDQRERQVRAAHEATRGIRIPVESKVKKALTIERIRSHATPVEDFLARALSKRFTVTQQKAIWIYNVDVAVHESSVAVEIFGGHWHSSGHHLGRFEERTKYILNHGWNMIIVWVDGRRYPLGRGGMSEIIKFAEACSSDPSPIGKYRVILGNGNDAPILDSNFNSPSVIERLCSRINITK